MNYFDPPDKTQSVSAKILEPMKPMELLRRLVEIERWAVAGDPRAQPYLDADAVRLVDGHAQFHRERTIAILAKEYERGR